MVGGKPNSYEPFDWVAWKGRGENAVSRDDTGVDMSAARSSTA
jgi:hypothetical protein